MELFWDDGFEKCSRALSPFDQNENKLRRRKKVGKITEDET